MKRKRKVEVKQDPFATVRKVNPPWGRVYDNNSTESSQYTEKCYNGSPLIENKCHINFKDIKRKNMIVI